MRAGRQPAGAAGLQAGGQRGGAAGAGWRDRKQELELEDKLPRSRSPKERARRFVTSERRKSADNRSQRRAALGALSAGCTVRAPSPSGSACIRRHWERSRRTNPGPTTKSVAGGGALIALPAQGRAPRAPGSRQKGGSCQNSPVSRPDPSAEPPGRSPAGRLPVVAPRACRAGGFVDLTIVSSMAKKLSLVQNRQFLAL